jgi:hypothetical protein
MTRLARRLYQVAIIGCVIDIALCAMVLHVMPQGWPATMASLSMGLCIAMGVTATQRLRRGHRKGIKA